MSKTRPRDPQRRHLQLAWLLLVFSFASVASAAEKSVLFIHTHKSNGPAAVPYDTAFQAALTADTSEQIILYNEYTDLWRFGDEEYARTLNDFYRRKYAGQHFDLIVVSGAPALKFLVAHGEELFPGTPVVFCLLMEGQLIDGLSSKTNFTGVLERFDFKKSLESALRLQPDTRRVFVVGGSSPSDQSYLVSARKDFQQFEGQVEFTYLTDLPHEAVERRVSQLPEHSIVFYLSLFRDSAGRSLPGGESAARIGKAANAPFYSCSEIVTSPAGGVGGYLWSADADAIETAKTARQILAGARPEDLPIHIGDTNRYIFDWTQMQRWGISESRLPPGSILRNRIPSLWEQYRWRIVGVSFLCILEALLIVWLLINRNRRRRAEEAKNNLAAIVETSDDAILSETLEGVITSWNAGAEKMYGYSAREIVGKHYSTLAPPDLNGEVLGNLERVGRGESVDHLETVGVSKEGMRIDVSLTISPIKNERGMIIGASTIARDITERKAAEHALRNALIDVERLKEQVERENIYLKEEIELEHGFREIIGESKEIKYVFFKINQVAPTDSTVLLLGETGTGKELVARAIHGASTRKDRPLVKINCAALPASLIESELFGHEKGAFTGAHARKIGRFEVADGATLFLDEIGELPLELQSKLLRVLQEGEFERLGSSRSIKVNVRIIAATNRNLKVEVQKGLFREDLWYRLNVFPITIQPLRQRKGDISLLVDFFVNKFNRQLGKFVKTISPATLKALQNYDWPGNVRELANVLERAMISSQSNVLHLAETLDDEAQSNGHTVGSKCLQDVERHHILTVLDECNWRIQGLGGAADILKINSSTLRSRMVKLGIQQTKSTVSIETAD